MLTESRRSTMASLAEAAGDDQKQVTADLSSVEITHFNRRDPVKSEVSFRAGWSEQRYRIKEIRDSASRGISLWPYPDGGFLPPAEVRKVLNKAMSLLRAKAKTEGNDMDPNDPKQLSEARRLAGMGGFSPPVMEQRGAPVTAAHVLTESELAEGMAPDQKAKRAEMMIKSVNSVLKQAKSAKGDDQLARLRQAAAMLATEAAFMLKDIAPNAARQIEHAANSAFSESSSLPQVR